MTTRQLAIEPAPLGPAASRQEAASLPLVSLIVPCRNEEQHITKCLDSILASSYPRERMEILVLDGMSEDGTREIVTRYAQTHNSVRLVDNPEKHIPAAFNAGIRNATGETVMLMSAHAGCDSNYVRLCVAYQEKYGVENVGGVWNMLPGSDTAMAKAIVLALGHRFGSGNAKVKVGASQPTWSDAVAYGCYKKDLFAKIGMFNERLKGSSDMDINMRILAA